jgi:hypothetical protein
VREATAQDSAKRITKLLFARIRLLVKNRFGGEDHPAQAKAALSSALFNETLLDGVRLFRRA